MRSAKWLECECERMRRQQLAKRAPITPSLRSILRDMAAGRSVYMAGNGWMMSDEAVTKPIHTDRTLIDRLIGAGYIAVVPGWTTRYEITAAGREACGR